MNKSDFLDYLSAQNCVFWDWNGTLLDDLDYSLGVTNRILQDHGVTTLSKHYYQKHFTIPVRDYYEFLGLDQKDLSFDRLSELFISQYQSRRHEISLFEGARECLEFLKKQNVPQVLFSAAHIQEIEFQVQLHKLEPYFMALSGAGDHHGGCKKDRGLDLQKEHNFKSGVLLGDTLHDIEIGKEMGFDTVWLSEGHQSLDRALQSKDVDYIYLREEEKFFKKP